MRSCLWVHSINFILTWFIWLYVCPPLHFLYQLYHKSVPCKLYWKSNMCDWDIVNNKVCSGPRAVRFWLIKFNILKGAKKKKEKQQRLLFQLLYLQCGLSPFYLPYFHWSSVTEIPINYWMQYPDVQMIFWYCCCFLWAREKIVEVLENVSKPSNKIRISLNRK